MQFSLVSTYWASALGVQSLAGGFALIMSGGLARLIYSEAQVNQAMSLSLGSVTAPGSGFVTPQALAAPIDAGNLDPGTSMAFHVSGSQIRTYLFDARMGVLASTLLNSAGQPGTASTVTTSEGILRGVQSFAVLGGATGSHAALSKWNAPGIDLFRIADSGALTLTDRIEDSDKTHIANVSDTATLTLTGQDYLLTLSSLENGLTSFAVDDRGRGELIDSLANRDGLAITGPAALQVMTVGGQSFAVIASTGSSSISVVRVNDMGCLFQTDHMIDDRSTRFAHTQVLDSFTHQGRSFVVTAGNDAGITILELLPGGRLTHFATGVFETGPGLAAVTGLDVVVKGGIATIYVVDARSDRVQSFDLSLLNLGGMVQPTFGQALGGTRDDLILGGAGAETLSGGAGDDWLISGGGADRMSGGSGADTFVFAASSDNVVITDYALHQDRIDLSDWGRVYTAAALQITSTATGAVIGLNGHDVTLIAGQRLTAADFTDADFLF